MNAHIETPAAASVAIESGTVLEIPLNQLKASPKNVRKVRVDSARGYPNGHRCQFFVMLFFADTFEGFPRVADDESCDIGWFEVEALPEMLPNMRRSVQAFQAFRATGAFQMI